MVGNMAKGNNEYIVRRTSMTENAINSKPKIRSPYWDNIKGVLILLVVFAHCLYGIQDKEVNRVIVDFIYYFHMPAFVFVSGFFSKSERCRSTNSIIQLLVGYLIFMLPFIFWKVHNGAEPKLINPYYSAWYLLALVVWRVITPYLAKFKHIMPAIIVFSILVGFWKTINGNTAFAISKVVTFWPYFMAGYLLNGDTVENKIKSKPAIQRLGLGAISVVCGVLLQIASYKPLNIGKNDLLPNAYKGVNLVDPASRIVILLVSACFILGFLYLSVDKRIPLITMSGRNSLSIFLFHRIFTLIFSNYTQPYRARVQILLAVLATVAIALVFGNDFVSKYINLFIKNCADSVSFLPNSNEKKTKIYRAILLILLAIAFVGPICIKFVGAYMS